MWNSSDNLGLKEPTCNNMDNPTIDTVLKDMHTALLTNTDKFFPELVWKKVLEKLSNRSEIESCCGASPFFRYLLEEKRETRVVLPQVFGLLAKRYCDINSRDNSYRESCTKSIPWKFFSSHKTNRMTGIWKCRLVCKKWNKAIEEIHQNEDAGYFWMHCDFELAENSRLRFDWGTDDFCDELKVVKFLNHFEATHYDNLGNVSLKCPFLGRSVKFDFYAKVTNQPFFNRVLEMLEKFGTNVWYLVVGCWEISTVEDHIKMYRNLRKTVELMPNLKVLTVTHMFMKELPYNIELFRQEMNDNPFPNLAKLIMISARNLPASFFSHLIARNKQISYLQVSQTNLVSENCDFFGSNLVNLTRLSLEIDSLEVFETFEKYQNKWNLERFYFEYSCNSPFIPWARIWSAIESKVNSDSCTDLVLCMPLARKAKEKRLVVEESLFYRLELKNIQRVKVDQGNRFCLDFLLPSKNSLREIELWLWLSADYAFYRNLIDKQVIQYLEYEESMERSNIGRELPRLKKLLICRRFLTNYYFHTNGVIVKKEERCKSKKCSIM